MGRSNRLSSSAPPLRQMGVDERRSHVLALWNNTDLTQKEIARRLGASEKDVRKDLRLMREDGEKVDGLGWNRRTIAARRQKILRLRQESHLSNKEIASRLAIPLVKVKSDIKALREAGKDVAMPGQRNQFHKNWNKKRAQEILGLWNDKNLTNREIAKELNISKEEVTSYLNALRRRGINVTSHARDYKKVQERRERVLTLWNSGMAQAEIAQKLGVTKGVVQRDLSELRKAGQATRDGKAEERKAVSERKQKVLELNQAGQDIETISSMLGIRKETVRSDLYKLDHEGKTIIRPSPDNPLDNRRKKVQELWNRHGLSAKEISLRLSIPKTTVVSDLNVLRERGSVKKHKRGRTPSAKVTARREKAWRLKQEKGLTARQIAKEMGVSLETAEKDLRTIRLSRESQSSP